MIDELIIIATILFAFFIFSLNTKKTKNYPPGPPSLPFVGAFPLLALAGDFGLVTKLIQCGEKFGKIFSLDLGSSRFVVINSSALIKEAFGNVATSGRPKLETFRSVSGGNFRGIALQDGQGWKEHRQFTIKSLKDFGFGKKCLEPIIVEEAQDLVNSLKPLVGKPVSFQNAFNIAVINALWTITAEERFSHDDPKLLHLVNIISNLTSQTNMVWIFFFPWLSTFFPTLSGWNGIMETVHSLRGFIQELVDSKRKTFIKGVRRHFADVYFEELDNRKLDLKSSFSGKTGEENMTAALVDLFFAGSETTSTTLSWICLYLALHPTTQEKVQAEIDQVIGKNLPSLDHRKSMPYTEAVIFESLRCSSVTQVGITRRVLDDFEVGGYIIPKGTLVISNIYAAHHDPDVWEEPYSFKPERFLSSDKKQVIKHNAFIAFSFGKRSCLGETLAKDQIFIFLTSIVQRFEIALDPSAKVPTMNAKFSTTRSPVPHKLVLADR